MSLRLRLIQLGMGLIARPQIERVKSPAQLRKSFDFSARFILKSPPYSLFLPTEFPGGAGPCDALWISNGQPARRQVVLYFHGGGYVSGSPGTHRGMLARLSKLSGLRVFAPDYRLAPEHKFPAALQDARAAFSFLIAKGYQPKDIAIGGDSAGGGLALALLSELCRQGQAPGAVFTFSPWCDLTLGGASLKTNAASDRFLPVRRIAALRAAYAGDHDPADPGMSPLMADFSDCPPAFFQYSATEILRDDSHRMADHLRAQGAEVTQDEWENAPHVWQILDGYAPEARQALEATAYFLRSTLQLPAIAR